MVTIVPMKAIRVGNILLKFMGGQKYREREREREQRSVWRKIGDERNKYVHEEKKDTKIERRAL